MDVDGPPEVSSVGEGKSGVAVREEDRWQRNKEQKLETAVAATLVVEGVELPNVQAPTDLPQVRVLGHRV